MDISVILPVYNERENLSPLLTEIESALEPMNRPFEIVAINDGSTDGSGQLLGALAEQRPNLKVVSLRSNSGQTAAFDAGFRFASGKIMVTMDADGQNDPKDIPRLVSKIEEGYDFVSGRRKNRKDTLLSRKLPSRIANWIIRFVTGTKIQDLGCSLKAYRKNITDELRLYGEMHRFIGPLVENLGARVTELDVNHRPRMAGQSKYGLSRTVKVVLDLMTVWFMKRFQTKPIYIFGGIGIISIFLGAVTSGMVLYSKFISGIWVHKNPLFLVSIMFTLAGAQFLGLGLIAEMMIRTYFESQNKLAYSISETIGFGKK